MIIPMIGRRWIAAALAGQFLAVACVATMAASVAGTAQAAVPARADSSVTATPSEEALLARLRNMADPAADKVVDSLFADDLVAQANTALRTWTTNGQPLPEAMPTKLRTFLSSALTLPTWTDAAAIGRAQKFLSDHTAATVLLEAMYVVPERARYSGEVQVLHGVEGPHDTAAAAGKASQFITSLMTPGSLGPTGDLLVNALKIRLVHAAVRHLLLTQTHWDAATYGPPISQVYMLAEWSLLTVSVGDALAKVGAGMSEAQAADDLHTWRVLGTVMGLTEDAMATTWADARHLAQVIDARYAVVGTSEAAYAQGTLDFLASQAPPELVSKPLFTAIERYLVGDTHADELGLARNAFLDPAMQTFLPTTVTGTLPATGNPFFPTALFTDLTNQAIQRYTGRGQKTYIELPTSLYQAPA